MLKSCKQLVCWVKQTYLILLFTGFCFPLYRAWEIETHQKGENYTANNDEQQSQCPKKIITIDLFLIKETGLKIH